MEYVCNSLSLGLVGLVSTSIPLLRVRSSPLSGFDLGVDFWFAGVFLALHDEVSNLPL
jgi:hypothetical protein